MLTDLLHFGGVEIANAIRTTTYAQAFNLAWFNPPDPCDGLAGWLGETYTTPSGDGAPWLDPARAETYDFAGFYPLEITNADDSTLNRVVTGRIRQGGVVGLRRWAAREMVVRGLLLGVTAESVSVGGDWLNSTLNGQDCDEGYSFGVTPCGGFDLDFYAVCPHGCGCDGTVCDAECAVRWERHYHDVALTDGLHVLQAKCVGSRGYMAEIEFTLVAGNPFRYGNPLYARSSPFAFNYTKLKASFANYTAYHAAVATYADTWDVLWDLQNPVVASGFQSMDEPSALAAPEALAVNCAIPVADPDCGTPPQFPAIPQAGIYCGTLWTGAWKRLTYSMQAYDVVRWAEQLPVLSFYDGGRSQKDIRVRYTRAGDNPDTDYISQFYITYLPQSSLMNLDGPRDRITLERGCGTENVEHLVVMDSRGSPFRWPVVTCGGAWTITVDVPTTSDTTTLEADLSLVLREP